MENIERLVATSMGEIEKLLNTKAVVGESVTSEGNTIIPLMSIAFVFAAGGGSGKGSGKGDKGRSGDGAGEGGAEGTAGGGGIKPTAVIIINQEGVRVEPVKGGATSVLEKIGETVEKIVTKRDEKGEEK
ncbi:MAG: spore germination protein GerW family protein [Dehalococcoidia bacterium]